jgi:transposase
VPHFRKNPLRTLKPQETLELQRISRSESLPADQVTRAKIILGVAEGLEYRQTALLVGRKSRVSVSRIVARFNDDGLQALQARHGGGAITKYTPELRNVIIEIARSTPNREFDGTAVWSIVTLQRRLRRDIRFKDISVSTILGVLHEAGLTWQKNRTWCETGVVQRKRKVGIVSVIDPDCEVKKT